LYAEASPASGATCTVTVVFSALTADTPRSVTRVALTFAPAGESTAAKIASVRAASKSASGAQNANVTCTAAAASHAGCAAGMHVDDAFSTKGHLDKSAVSTAGLPGQRCGHREGKAAKPPVSQDTGRGIV